MSPAPRIPVDRLHYATVVARDAKQTAREHAQLFGIERWTVTHATPERLKSSTIFGRVPTAPPLMDVQGVNPVPGAYSFICATGSNASGSISFQIVQPTGGLSTFEEFLVTRGPGIHSVFMSVVEPKDFPALKDWLKSEGIRVAQSFSFEGVADYYYFDTRAHLGGFYLQMVVPKIPDWEGALPVDEVWDFSAEITRSAQYEIMARSPGLTHFGVVVRDVRATVENFARLFQQPLWRGMHWRTEPGWLEDTTNNGKPVVHGYLTGRGELWKNSSGVGFGFEVIQPAFGPSHYKEDFLDLYGPGIHHADVKVPMDWPQWETLNAWFRDSFDAPTCMSGWLRNHAALFHYQDTRRRLGYVTEYVAPPVAGKPAKGWAPDYWFDFTGQVD